MSLRRGPRLTEADRAVWANYARSVRPLRDLADLQEVDVASAPVEAGGDRQDPGGRAGKLAMSFRPYQVVRPATVIPLSIGTAPAGLDAATWTRFRTGKLAATRKLDLHGMTAQRAFLALNAFLRAAHADRARCVEIVTGRGSGEGTGVIRRELPLWLNLPELRPLVLGAAYPHAANPGAVRLLLRRLR